VAAFAAESERLTQTIEYQSFKHHTCDTTWQTVSAFALLVTPQKRDANKNPARFFDELAKKPATESFAAARSFFAIFKSRGRGG